MHPGVYLPHNRGVLVVATVTGSKASASPELLSQYIHLYIYINIYITLDWGTKVTKLALSTELRPARPVDPCLWATSRVFLRRGQHTSYLLLIIGLRHTGGPLMDHFNSTDTTLHSFPASSLSPLAVTACVQTSHGVLTSAFGVLPTGLFSNIYHDSISSGSCVATPVAEACHRIRPLHSLSIYIIWVTSQPAHFFLIHGTCKYTY